MNRNIKEKCRQLLIVFVALLCLVLMLTGCGASSDDNVSVSGNAEPGTDTQVTDDGAEYYTPDKFSFEGGTGKVGISCEAIIIDNDETFATIQFSSDAYTYIRVGDEKTNCDHGEGTSYATIPIILNANNTIYAETTKMSEAHEIEYRILVYLQDGNPEGAADCYALLNTSNLDETAPLIPGIEAAQEEAVLESENCKVFAYNNDVKLLEIKMKDSTETAASIADPAAYTTKAMTIEDAREKLYAGSVIKYILVPEGTELPAGIEKEAIVIPTPITNVYSGSADISLKDLLAEKYDLVLLSPEILADGNDAFETFAADAASLGIPVMIEFADLP